MHDIEYNKIFEFDLTDQVSFGGLTDTELESVFKDGRAFSQPAQIWLTKKFPIEFVNQIGFDYIMQDNPQIKFELKTYTTRGCNLLPSKMKGKGRKANLTEWHNTAETINYIIADNTNFPKIRVVFKHGKDLLHHYPNGVIK